MKEKPIIFLTNDDGIIAEGLKALQSALRGLGEIWVIAPDREKSASALSLTLHRPLRVEKARARTWAVDGTPSDCVYLAVKKILPYKPALIISGINRGPNLAKQDVSHSGTVAAALQARYLGLNSLAVSTCPDKKGKYHFAAVARVVRKLVEKILGLPVHPIVALNVNFPPPPFRGACLTVLGEKKYNPEIIEKKDPRGKTYYWIGTGSPELSGCEESDIFAIARGLISITPLHTDLTDYKAAAAAKLKKMVASFAADDATFPERRTAEKG